MRGHRPLPPGSETARAIRGLLMPRLAIREGQVLVEGPGGLTVARDPEGKLFDILDVSDQLGEKFGRLYLLDLDGLEHDQPQLDYLQEIARTAEVWVDSGVRTSDQAIDVVVAGAFRTVLSTAHLRGIRELEQAWKLSPEVAFEIETHHGKMEGSSPEFSGPSIPALLAQVRSVGVKDVILSPRGAPVDWVQVRELAKAGPLWVNGSFERDDLGRLAESGAVGGIFSIEEELGLHPAPAPPLE